MIVFFICILSDCFVKFITINLKKKRKRKNTDLIPDEDDEDRDDPLSTRMRRGIERVVTRKSVLFIYNIYKGVV